MQNISRVGDHWPHFKSVAADAQRLFRQVLQQNKGGLPRNGIIIFVGSMDTRQNIVFEPPTPVKAPVHLCDAKYHIEYLSALTCEYKYGFIIVDGNGCLFGTLCGNERSVKEKFTVDLPNKHRRGGQSALRFARLRLEKRHNYMRRIAERATQCFISEEVPNITGLIIAGAAELKEDLASNALLDSRLRAILVGTLDLAYGGEHGFDQAINLSVGILHNLEFVKEKQVISKFMDEVKRDTCLYCFEMEDTMAAMESGAIETLIVWDQLPTQRLVVRNVSSGDSSVSFTNGALTLSPDEQIEESLRFVDWILENHDAFGAKLEFITDKSHEGNQFCKGFGGIGGLLRYHFAQEGRNEDNQPNDEDADTDSDFE